MWTPRRKLVMQAPHYDLTVRQPSDRRGPMRTRRTGIHRYIGKAPLLERRLTRRSLHERSTKCYEYFASFGKKVKEGRFKSVVGYPHRAHISDRRKLQDIFGR